MIPFDDLMFMLKIARAERTARVEYDKYDSMVKKYSKILLESYMEEINPAARGLELDEI